MKTTLVLLFALATYSASAQWESQYPGLSRFPIRYVTGRQYNLFPLFRWWTNAEYLAGIQSDFNKRTRFKEAHGVEPTNAIGRRPAVGWIRLTGTQFEEHPLGWIVTGKIEESPGERRPAKFLLEHPPREDRTQYEENRREWNDLVNTGHIAIGTQLYQDVQGRKWWNVSGIPIDDESVHRMFFVGGDSVAAQRALEINRYLSRMPGGPTYRLDLFAVKVGYLTDGSHLEVFDLGLLPASF